MPLHQDVQLSIEIGATLSRNKWSHDPDPVVAEIIALARDRTDILTQEVGRWIGYYESTESADLCTALRELPGLDEWILLGRRRRDAPQHGSRNVGPEQRGLRK